MTPTRANRSLAVKISGYNNLVDVLEYAAQGDTGYNFYDGRGHLSSFRFARQNEDRNRNDDEYDTERSKKHRVQVLSAAAHSTFHPFSEVEGPNGDECERQSESASWDPKSY